VFLNGDYLPWGPRDAGLGQISQAVLHRKYGRLGREWTGWDLWWKRLGKEPTLRPLLREREARFAHNRHTSQHFSLEGYLRSLRGAGFRDVGVVWQEMENRVVLARKGARRR
jgi:hypothetical protein